VEGSGGECPQSHPSRIPSQSGGLAAAQAHVARTVCRRAERSVVAVNHAHAADAAAAAPASSVGEAAPPSAAAAPAVQPEVTRFLNRLSDYLFVLARFLAAKAGAAEAVYKKDAGVTLRPLERGGGAAPAEGDASAPAPATAT
jgi:hypothetical protein